jgi:hypothetical protein
MQSTCSRVHIFTAEEIAGGSQFQGIRNAGTVGGWGSKSFCHIGCAVADVDGFDDVLLNTTF